MEERDLVGIEYFSISFSKPRRTETPNSPKDQIMTLLKYQNLGRISPNVAQPTSRRLSQERTVGVLDADYPVVIISMTSSRKVRNHELHGSFAILKTIILARRESSPLGSSVLHFQLVGCSAFQFP